MEQVVVRPMHMRDIPAVLAIEKRSFPKPWSKEAFESELRDNYLARYYCLVTSGKVIGYMGLWIIIDEAHITNVAIWPSYRGRGLGEYLMRVVMREMVKASVKRLTLEVRVTNKAAQKLYGKLGFVPAGIRKRYYSDNQEDALVMWAPVSYGI